MHIRLSMPTRSALACATLAGCIAACSDDPASSGDTIVDTSPDVDSGNPDTSVPDSSNDASPDSNDATDAGADASTPVTVVINEVGAAGDPTDWVELYNPGNTSVDLSGWLFRDDDEAHAFVLPSGSILPPGAYKVIARDEVGFDFGLGAADAAFLFDASGELVDQTNWLEGESPTGRSWGRIPNASGSFQTLVAPTPGAINVENPAAICGNGDIEGFEVCDSDNFGTASCKDYGWGGGSLTCLEDCSVVGQAACDNRESGLVINEVESDETDRIELYNGTGLSFRVGGYTLTDGAGNTFALPALDFRNGMYLVFTRDVDHLFGLGDADTLTLTDADGDIVDTITWSSGQAVPSFARSPDGVGGFATSDEQSFGAKNFE